MPGVQGFRSLPQRMKYGVAAKPVSRPSPQMNAQGWLSRSLRTIHQEEAGNSSCLRSRGHLLSTTSGDSPRFVPYMNPGRKKRGCAQWEGIAMRITPEKSCSAVMATSRINGETEPSPERVQTAAFSEQSAKVTYSSGFPLHRAVKMKSFTFVNSLLLIGFRV